jgi:hypothetical protein
MLGGRETTSFALGILAASVTPGLSFAQAGTTARYDALTKREEIRPKEE